MRRGLWGSVAVLMAAALSALVAQQVQVQLRHVHLPNDKDLIGRSPGFLTSLNGFTPTIALSPDHRYAALLHDGYGTQRTQAHQSIAILDLSTNQLTDFPDERLGEGAHQSYFIGLAFSSDGHHLYASMGSVSDATGEKPGDTGNGIAVYGFQQGKISPERFIKIAPQEVAAGKRIAHALQKTAPGTAIPYPAGLAVVAKPSAADQLLVANNYSDNVVLIDSASGKVLRSFDLSRHRLIPSEFPYTCVAARDGVRAWCSLWNGSRVAMLNLESGQIVRSIPLNPPDKPEDPGSHPTAVLLSPDEQYLFVALSNADRVVMVRLGSGPDLPLVTSLKDGGSNDRSSSGSCPSALALSADGSRLFVADSCINAVAVFDVTAIRHSPILTMPLFTPLGFIPTDWYPTALGTVGDDLLIASSKGQGSGPNNFPGDTGYERRHHETAYIPTLLYGSLARVSLAGLEKELPEFTERVKQSNLANVDPGTISFAGGGNPIRHVIYIIKENRTYDQVLGDLPVGNGDRSLTLYGSDVTPNEHKLALQFGVLDNFYDSGEVSGDGHEWSTAAIATDYNENTWQINYRSKERTYDFQGNVADEFPLEEHESDIDAPTTGYIWDNVARHGISYRDYGEFVTTFWCKPEGRTAAKSAPSSFSVACPTAEVKQGEALPKNVGQPRGGPSPWPWPVPMIKSDRATKAVLREHFDSQFPDFNTEYPDQLRADEFLDEFDGFVQARKEGKGTELPRFVLLYLPDDHTHGTTPGKPRPAASVADNDLAVGRVVEAVSHSPYWEDTAILMLEDDAQDGADHVDAHRSIAFVISKYSPGSTGHPFVESRFYTTVNLIHTMEALLGLPPMNQNDGHAPLMGSLFLGSGNQPPFTADRSNRENGLIYQVNPPRGQGAAESASMDFSRPDRANPAVLNAILWRDRKGDAPMPTPRHSVIPGN